MWLKTSDHCDILEFGNRTFQISNELGEFYMDNTPISPWKYLALEILYSIPIVGLVFLIIHAIGARNINKRNFARSYFCFVILLAIIILIIVLATGGFAGIASLFGAK